MVRVAAGDGHPDVTDDAGAGFIEQSESLAGGDLSVIRVSTTAIVTGRPFQHVVLGLGKSCEGGAGVLGKSSDGANQGKNEP